MCVPSQGVMPLQLGRQSVLLAIFRVFANRYLCWSRGQAGVSKGHRDTALLRDTHLSLLWECFGALAVNPWPRDAVST